MSVVALCGGVGGAKLAAGLAAVLPPDELDIVVNTGDDFEHLGLLICPDIDTVLYTLSGNADRTQGWGRADESHGVMAEVAALGGPTWFSLGDKDIALHLLRRELLAAGGSLTRITADLARRLGVNARVLPMSDQPVRTIVHSDAGALAFQDYFVRLRCEPRVSGFDFAGADDTAISPELDALLASPGIEAIILCPSNPFVSIGPILAVPGLRDRLRATGAPIVAVSPIVGGQAIKGPAAKMMAELRVPVSAQAVADHYGDWIDALVVDEADAAIAGPRIHVRQTVMRTDADRAALASAVLQIARNLARS